MLLALLGKREYKGSIRIGGVEARDLSSEAVGQVSSITPQDPIKFPGTLESNLYLRESEQPETKATSDAINELLNGILEKLGLFHLSGPAETGYKQLVSDIPLSQGQIVLVNLARCAMDVLQKQKRIVLIDDVFSKLDQEYADMAKDFIARAFRSCIVIQAQTTSAPHLSIHGVQPLRVGAAEIGFHPLHASQFRAWDDEIRHYFRSLRAAPFPSSQASSSPAQAASSGLAQTDDVLFTDLAAPAEQASSSIQAAPVGDVVLSADQPVPPAQEQAALTAKKAVLPVQEQAASTAKMVPTHSASSVDPKSHAAPVLPSSDTSHAVQGPSIAGPSRSKPTDAWLQPRRPPPPRPPTGSSQILAKMSSARGSTSRSSITG